MTEKNPEVAILGRRYLRGGTRGSAFVLAVAAFDAIARALLGRTSRRDPPRLESGSRIAVAKIDHLGDVVQATAFLAELRRQAPEARVTLVVGRWCEELAEILRARGLVHDTIRYDAWSLARSGSLARRVLSQASTFRRALARLRELSPDCYVDLRVFTPNSLFLARLANVPYRVGFGLRGLAFTLHEEIPYSAGRPFGQLFLDALPALGLRSATYERPDLGSGTLELTPTIASQLPNGPYVVAHLGSGNASKEVSREQCAAVLRRIAADVPVIAVGTAGEARRFQWLTGELPHGRLVNLMGRTSLADLLAVVERSAGGIVSDSFVGHTLLAFERPLLVLMAKRFAVREAYPAARRHLWLVDVDDSSAMRDASSAFRAVVAASPARESAREVRRTDANADEVAIRGPRYA
jgi:ADP-heptose:LPS heptosyltransferase